VSRVRYIGGVRFLCERPGTWFSEDRTLAIHHIYRTRGDDDTAELLDHALTMGELCYGSTIERLQAQPGPVACRTPTEEEAAELAREFPQFVERFEL